MSEEIKQKASWAVPWENQLNELLEEKIQDVYNAGSKYLYVYDNTTETYTSCGSEIHTLLNKELGDFINSLLSQALQKRDEEILAKLNSYWIPGHSIANSAIIGTTEFINSNN